MERAGHTKKCLWKVFRELEELWQMAVPINGNYFDGNKNIDN